MNTENIPQPRKSFVTIGEILPLPDSIETVEDVLNFHRAIWSEGTNYHPEEDFFNYVHIVGEDEFGNPIPCYTHEEATLRNTLLDQAYAVCEAAGVDICEVGQDEFMFLIFGEWPLSDEEFETDGAKSQSPLISPARQSLSNSSASSVDWGCR
jgi:hypothetical protein